MTEAYAKLNYFYRRWLKDNSPKELPKDVIDLFNEYNEEEGAWRMPINKLCTYLVKQQGVAENEANEEARKIIASRRLKGFTNFRKNSISRKGFFQYLLSRKNHPLIEKEFDDGNAKLAHYYVYTSHCSYLKQDKPSKHNITADKLKKTMPFFESYQKGSRRGSKSKSADEPSNKNTTDHKKEQKTFHNSITAIDKALKNGVRVIELDLRLNKGKNDIKVTHPSFASTNDRTTSQKKKSIPFKRCLDNINEKAFVHSKYPLMIILVQNFDSEPSDVQFLQNKLNKWIENSGSKDKLCSLKEAFEASTLDSLKKKFIFLTSKQMKDEPSSTNTNDKKDYIYDYKEIPESIGNDLGTGSFRIKRLTENDIENASSTEYTSLTQKELLAVYPNFSLNDITNNFDPLVGWTRGAQMVSTNPQYFDKHLWVVQGLFRAHKQLKNPTGYVKKPEILLRNQIFNPTEWRPVKKILKVKVYLGTGWHSDFSNEDFDDTSPPDFFTAVEIVGVPVDEAREKTVPAMDQWVPVWDQEFEFPLTVPELAMLMIEVKEFDTDRTHDFGGQTCLPVRLIRSGIRSVPLYQKNGNPCKSARLLMRFKFN